MTGTRRLCARLGLRSIQFAGGIPCARGAMPNFCALTGSAPLLQYGSSPFEAAWASGAVAGATAPAQTQHFLSFSAAARQPSREEIDLHYRAGVNELWPMTRQQRRLAARVQAALEESLMHDTALRETLVRVHGFTVQEVRMSPDNMKAFVLWRAFPHSEDTARVELNRRLAALRAAAARRLQIRRMPRLEMRHDRLTDQQARLEELMAQIRAERAAEAANEDGKAEEAGFFDDEGDEDAEDSGKFR